MNSEEIEEILKNIGAGDTPADVHKVAQELSRDFNKTLTKLGQPKRYVLGEYIMKNSLTKLTLAAAVIIIVVFIGLPFIGHKDSSVALADVLARVEQARAFMYKMKMAMTGTPSAPTGKQEMEGTITISNEYGMKLEMDITDLNTGKKTTQQMYILPVQKTAFMIMPETKKYMEMEFSDDLLNRMKKQNNDPREMIKQIMNCKYTDLGRSVIDGVQVEGFHTTDPAMLAGAGGDGKYTLWVDAQSWLPVRADADLKMSEQMQIQYIIYDFTWDIPVNISDFEPIIPQDYTAILPGGYKLPSASEEGAIDGLRLCEQIIGRYPKKIDMMNLMNEIMAIKDINNPTEVALKLKEELDKLPEEEKAKKIMEVMRPVQSLAIFYMTLVQDKKEPVYYGESVGPDDIDAVLLRWTVSDNRYRVTFGDLTVADVTAEELDELESSLLEQ